MFPGALTVSSGRDHTFAPAAGPAAAAAPILGAPFGGGPPGCPQCGQRCMVAVHCAAQAGRGHVQSPGRLGPIAAATALGGDDFGFFAGDDGVAATVLLRPPCEGRESSCIRKLPEPPPPLGLPPAAAA